MGTIAFGFLYFPEDKSAYIPAAFEFLIVLILCILAFMWVKRLSKKQEMKMKSLEERVLRERQQNSQNESNE